MRLHPVVCRGTLKLERVTEEGMSQWAGEELLSVGWNSVRSG